ncbi:DUF488 domain-containing protein [Aliidiomarina sp. Khilg15.8]
MQIQLKRIYDGSSKHDGYRVLVDGMWPRGVSKSEARIDEWLKDIAPSDDLRKAFHNHDIDWGEFRQRYLSELKDHRDDLRPVAEKAAEGQVTLLFASQDTEHNNAVVVKQYLQMLTPEN